MGPFHITQIVVLGFHEFLKLKCALDNNSEVKGHQRVTHGDIDGSLDGFDHFRFDFIPHSQLWSLFISIWYSKYKVASQNWTWDQENGKVMVNLRTIYNVYK